MTIQQTINNLTIDVWDNIGLSNRLHTKYGEETISDILLLELAKLRNYNLRIIQTPKDREKYKGTDWEWFIGSQSYGWIRFAIQAKKADPNSKNGDYSCLKHTVGTEEQIDILKRYSKANNAVPLYCLYNHYSKANEPDHWHCKRIFEQKLLGWTITAIRNVETALTTHGCRNFEFMHKQKETLPTKCLFDCPVLIKQYQDKSLIDKKIKIFDTEVVKIKSIPSSLIEQRDITSIDNYPEELYNRQIEIYPKRIAIFNLGDDENYGR